MTFKPFLQRQPIFRAWRCLVAFVCLWLLAMQPGRAFALAVIEPPQDQTTKPGNNVAFSVIATGSPPVFYQWRLNGNPLLGETNSTLTLREVQAASGGAFSVTVWDADDALTTGLAVLNVLAATDTSPENFFASRPTLRAYSGIVQGNSKEAGGEPGEPLMLGGGKTVWCEWIAPEDGIVTLNTRGSAFDTMLGVFTGSVVSNLTLVARDDDLGGFYTSSLQFNAHRGTAYEFMLDGFDYEGTGGEFTLRWNLEPTTETVPIILLPPRTTSVLAGSNAMLRVVTDSTDVTYRWFFNGTLIEGATGPAYTILHTTLARVGHYHVRAMKTSGRFVDSPSVDLQICSGDAAMVQNNASVVMQDKYQSASPSLNDTNIFPPAAGTISIGLGNSYSKFASSSTNGQVGDPTPCSNGLYGTTWQAVLATNNGVIQVDTIGSPLLARLAVFQGAPNLPGTVLIGCDMTSCLSNKPCIVKFNATAGTNYTLVFEAYHTNGIMSFNCAMGNAPPVSNQLQSCLVALGGSFVLDAPANGWNPPPAYQWRFNSADLANATNASLLLTNFGLANAGTYRVVMSNFVATVTNQVSVLSLAGPFVLGGSWTTNVGKVGFKIAASNASPFILQASTNLNFSWQSLATNMDPCRVLLFTNANALLDPKRFFRAIPWPPPP